MFAKQATRRWLLAFFSAILVASTFHNLLPSNPVSAAPLATSIRDLDTHAVLNLATLYNSTYSCIEEEGMVSPIKNGSFPGNNNKDANIGRVPWFLTGDTVSFYNSGAITEATCNQAMAGFLEATGYNINGTDFLPELGYVHEPTGDNGKPQWRHPSLQNLAEDFKRLLYDKLFMTTAIHADGWYTSFNPAEKYHLYFAALGGSRCSGVVTSLPLSKLNSTDKENATNRNKIDDRQWDTINIAEPDGSVEKYGVSYLLHSAYIYGFLDSSRFTSDTSFWGEALPAITCEDAVRIISANAQGGADGMVREVCREFYSTVDEINACGDGVRNKADIMFCSEKYPSDEKRLNACYGGQGSPAGGKCFISGYKERSTLSACIEGSQNKHDDDFCSNRYDFSDFEDPSVTTKNREACTAGQKMDVPAGPSFIVNCTKTPNAPGCVVGSDCKPGENCDATSSCAIQGIGWIICPVVEFLAGIADAVYGFIEQFLSVRSGITEQDGSTYRAWEFMRNIANVVLIILFLFIIFSQLSGFGVSNYGIKKTLPRIIIAAILINISFFICQIAVDLSNILGATLKDFLTSLPVFNQSSENWVEDVLSKSNFFTNAAVSVLAGQATIAVVGTAAVAGYFLGIGIFIPVIVAVILAVIITFFILLARQMLIVILIVMAPVAFALMLLPNTEQWYKWWQKAFVGLLVVYPMIAILFGGSQLAANILVQVSPGDLGWQLAAASIAILPLFFTPALLKGSLNAIPAVGNAARALHARVTSAGSKWSGVGTKKLGEYSAAQSGSRFQKLSKAIHGGGTMGRLREAAAKRAYEEPRMKDIMMQWTQPGKDGKPAIAYDDNALMEIARSEPQSYKGQAALSLLAQKGSVDNLKTIRDGFGGDVQRMSAYNKAIAPHFGALKAKHPGAVMDMGANGEEWSKIKQADLHLMKDSALTEGAKNEQFRGTLAAAMQDPEQERHFTRAMYETMGITPPSEAAKRQPTSTAGGSGAPGSSNQEQPASTPNSTPPPAGYEQQDNGLFIPRDK